MENYISIEFKAKDHYDKWVYGMFTNEKIGGLIVPVIQKYRECDGSDYVDSISVDGNTLCQCIGKSDIAGTKIYTGDYLLDPVSNSNYLITWIPNSLKIEARSEIGDLLPIKQYKLCTINGNIND